MAACTLQWQSWVAATETMWLQVPNIYNLALCRKSFLTLGAEQNSLHGVKGPSGI